MNDFNVTVRQTQTQHHSLEIHGEIVSVESRRICRCKNQHDPILQARFDPDTGCKICHGIEKKYRFKSAYLEGVGVIENFEMVIRCEP